MSDIVIQLNGLGKQYRVARQRAGYRTLRSAVIDAVRRPAEALWSVGWGRRRVGDEVFWAFKDVSFEVERGEVVGVIGHNGAGKSTLLKVLSRITDPSEGYADIRGRVGSLLEVGTGFHPELTGRENVYLNGAILGMRRAEIERKFTEIVEFAGVAKFIDTPVKHYSTGMYLRLAFAVAAHLEPEILFVDEVLAVGDAAFQTKCLGKIGKMAEQGRTVLFVSHNMGVIRSLCSTAVLLKEGTVIFKGRPADAISKYLARVGVSEHQLPPLSARGGHGPTRFAGIRVLDKMGRRTDVVQSGQRVFVEVTYATRHDARAEVLAAALVCHIFVSTFAGDRLFTCSTRFGSHAVTTRLPPSGCIRCVIPALPLAGGEYLIDLVCKADRLILDSIVHAMTLTVVAGEFCGTTRLPPSSGGPILVEHFWQVANNDTDRADPCSTFLSHD